MSAWQERMTARSSTHSPVCGNRSETSMPLLPSLLKASLRAEQLRLAFDELNLASPNCCGPRLARQLVQQRLGIERLHVARAARHEQEDDRLCLCTIWRMRRLRGQWIDTSERLQHRAEGKTAKAAESVSQEFPPVPCWLRVVIEHRGSRSLQTAPAQTRA